MICFTNPELCKLTEDVIFSEAYRGAVREQGCAARGGLTELGLHDAPRR
ncbi:MAG TPA: hypothetical protein VKE41_21905 [Roseiflexaceae bacterium]|nr:hypothetical protein [Roseiflexaceae bacterium]